MPLIDLLEFSPYLLDAFDLVEALNPIQLALNVIYPIELDTRLRLASLDNPLTIDHQLRPLTRLIQNLPLILLQLNPLVVPRLSQVGRSLVHLLGVPCFDGLLELTFGLGAALGEVCLPLLHDLNVLSEFSCFLTRGLNQRLLHFS